MFQKRHWQPESSFVLQSRNLKQDHSVVSGTKVSLDNYYSAQYTEVSFQLHNVHFIFVVPSFMFQKRHQQPESSFIFQFQHWKQEL